MFFALLIFLPLYHWLVVNNAHMFAVNDVTYPFFAVDYSMGFCDKLFIGELFHLVGGKYNLISASVFVWFFYVTFMFVLAFFAQKFADAFQEKKKPCLVLLCFFFVGPFSVGVLVKEFGMLDFFWAFFFVMALLALKNRYLRFFVPVLAVFMILVHFGSLICYVAALLLIIAFYAFHRSDKKERMIYLVIFGITLACTVGLTLYFMKNNADNLVYSFEKFNAVLKERNANTFYFDFALYKEFSPEFINSKEYMQAYNAGSVGMKLSGLKSILDILLVQIKSTYYTGSVKVMILSAAAALFPQVLLMYILSGYLKIKNKFIKKIITVLFIILSFCIELIGFLFSSDTSRWVAHSVLLLFSFVLYILYLDYREGMERVDKFFTKIGYLFVYIILFFYANMVLEPYIFNYVERSSQWGEKRNIF